MLKAGMVLCLWAHCRDGQPALGRVAARSPGRVMTRGPANAPAEWVALRRDDKKKVSISTFFW